MHDAIIEEITGCRARLWSFSASHDRLAVEVRKDGKKPRYISFVLCEKIEAPASWVVQKPSIRKEGIGFVYRDEAAAIRCGEISVFDQPE